MTRRQNIHHFVSLGSYIFIFLHKFLLFVKKLGENFNISENKIISVEAAKVLQYYHIWVFAQEFSLVFCGICPTIWFLWSIVGSLLGMLTQWWCVFTIGLLLVTPNSIFI